MTAVRDLRIVPQPEFDAFVAAYQPPLTSRAFASGLVAYEDTSNGATWPESLVASYVAPAPPKRPRASGWRIPVQEA